jgi:hypothetical protein
MDAPIPRPNSAISFRLAGAFELGFSARGGFTDGLDDALSALVNDIQPPNLYTAIQTALARLESACLDRDCADEDRQSRADFNAWHICRHLAKLADQALPPSHALQPWYRMGAVLGEEFLKLRNNADAVADLQAISWAAMQLPLDCLQNETVLHRLRSLRLSDDPAKALREVLLPMAAEAPNRWKNPTAMVIERLSNKVTCDLKEASIDSASLSSTDTAITQVPPPRVTIKDSPQRVEIDEVPYPLPKESQFLFVKAVVEANGDYVGPMVMRDRYGVDDFRPRVRKKLPPAVSAIIETNKHGSRLVLDHVRR